ncbi:hypothetical protein THAOC_00771, partial [Thalassiosira oceanica]
ENKEASRLKTTPDVDERLRGFMSTPDQAG